MYKLSKKAILIVIAVLVVTGYCMFTWCSITDDKAIFLANDLLIKTNITTNNKPWVFRLNDNGQLMSFSWILNTVTDIYINKKVKNVVYGDKRNSDIDIYVGCAAKEVTGLINWNIRKTVFSKYNIPLNNRKPRMWPPFLAEDKAKEIVLSYANKIGFPKDVELYKMRLDLQNDGTWEGIWKRKFNGFPYEDDMISVEVMAIDGELYSYRKSFYGKPCSTNVKVTKEDAIVTGWKKMYEYFDANKAEHLTKEYEVKTAELKIVQPNIFFGYVIPIWKSNSSKLAWVIEYNLKAESDVNKYENKLAQFGHHDKFVLKFDSVTNKFLGGRTSPCK